MLMLMRNTQNQHHPIPLHSCYHGRELGTNHTCLANQGQSNNSNHASNPLLVLSPFLLYVQGCVRCVRVVGVFDVVHLLFVCCLFGVSWVSLVLYC
jgi:hypothetical protein